MSGRSRLWVCAGLVTVLGALCTSLWAAERPWLSVDLRPAQTDGYKKAVGPLLALSEAELLKLVPTQSGLYFVGCVNCTAGHQEGQLKEWDITRPYEVRCTHCGHAYPSEKYPATKVQEVKAPNGETHRYPYWENAEGYRYYFSARADYHRLRYLERATQNLARLYRLTGEAVYGRRAVLLLQRFAEVFPGYCYHMDYPFRPKIIFEGDVPPEKFKPVYRVARWTWWAYLDISRPLLEAYDLLAGSEAMQQVSRESGRDVEAAVVGLLTTMTEQVIANEDDLSNMSPGMWADFIAVGRVLGRPQYVHLALERLRRMIQSKFFADGSWMEGAPSYHAQVVGALQNVFRVAAGYSDPPDYRHPDTSARLDNLNLEQDLPEVVAVREALLAMRLPNGRLAPVHDTWWHQKMSAPAASEPKLLGGVGHGILGRGQGPAQHQAHLMWSPGLGHTHYDGLNLLFFAHGQELLSDLGYTHSRAREWTVATAAHNLVVVDLANQRGDRTTRGDVRFMTTPAEGPQILSVDNPQVYPGLTQTYRRTLALVPVTAESSYLLDVFTVAGGQTHDYFLHGSADEAQTLAVSPAEGLTAAQPRATLVPEGITFTPARHEQESPMLKDPGAIYGYLTGLREQQAAQATVATATFAPTATGPSLQAHLLLEPGDQLVTGENLSVRGANENDAKLADFRRQFLMLRRTGGASQFIAVLQAAEGSAPVKAVRRMTLAGAQQALEVELASGERDLILLQAQKASGTWQGQGVQANCELAIVRSREGQPHSATVVGGSVSWRALTLDAGANREAPLVELRRREGVCSLVVEGELLPAAGAVITVDHAGNHISAFEVKEAIREGNKSVITLAEEPGFDWDPATQTGKFSYLPLTTHKGPHTVRLTPSAHIQPAR